MKRSNTMSVHRSRDKHTQVKRSSKKFLAQSSQSHLVGFSHEYFTKTRVEGHSLGRSPGPVRQPVPLPRPPDDFLSPICQHRHTRDPLKEEKEHPTIRTRSSHEFLAALSLTLDSVRSSLSPVLCTHVYVWVCWVFGRWFSVSERSG